VEPDINADNQPPPWFNTFLSGMMPEWMRNLPPGLRNQWMSLGGGNGGGGVNGILAAGSQYQDPYSKENIISKLEGQWAEAKKANEDRYARLTSLLASREGLVKGYGEQEKKTARREFGAQEAQNESSLISRGLYNSGVLEATRRGNRSALVDSLKQTDERTGLLRSQMRGDLAGAIERRSDEYPQTDFYSQLILGREAAKAQKSGQNGANLVNFAGAVLPSIIGLL
jgi:hypothetical protein